ncbi:hypothetical protein HAX54_040644, partial [Datura stramonium]|nr:hypothetical protein [Datura stramonium]
IEERRDLLPRAWNLAGKIMDLLPKESTHPTNEEMSVLEVGYPLTESAMLMWRVGPAFEEPLDDE